MKDNYNKYKLIYWGYDPDDLKSTRLITQNVLVPANTWEAMLTTDIKSSSYYLFFIDDGEELIISADCVHSLTEVFEEN